MANSLLNLFFCLMSFKVHFTFVNLHTLQMLLVASFSSFSSSSFLYLPLSHKLVWLHSACLRRTRDIRTFAACSEAQMWFITTSPASCTFSSSSSSFFPLLFNFVFILFLLVETSVHYIQLTLNFVLVFLSNKFGSFKQALVERFTFLFNRLK